jgi:hypothetical protein
MIVNPVTALREVCSNLLALDGSMFAQLRRRLVSVMKEDCLDRALNQLHRVYYISVDHFSTTIKNSKFCLFNWNLE